jgi:dTDP-4-dehydrorhamnose 3,5-epimerase
MRFEATAINGVWLVHVAPQVDARGEFARLHGDASFDTLVPGLRFVQTNLSSPHGRGTLRGLHWQCAPVAEYKLVRCLRGAVFDVAADVREASPSFGRHLAVTLAAETPTALLLPPGVAHGFQALCAGVQLLYQHSASYDAARQAGVRHDDPLLAIRWPLPVGAPSPRDAQLPWLRHARAETGTQPLCA